MDLPGLGAESHILPAASETAVTEHDVPASCEWRFEVSFDTVIQVTLLSGTVELFGTELALERPYTFTGTKAALYTWHGCRLKVTGQPQSDYIADETSADEFANLHFAIDDIRIAASTANALGPRVMLVGPENTGKTTLAKLLAAYAVRCRHPPVVVNLDPRQGMLTPPDTLSAAALEPDSVLDVEEGWGSSPITGPSALSVQLPLVYYYGSRDPEERPDAFRPLVSRLALSVLNRLQDDPDTKAAGCIVDTPGAFEKGKNDYELLKHAVSEFQVTVLVVLGSPRLLSALSKLFTPTSHPDLTLVKIDRSSGSVDRSTDYVDALRRAQIRSYFFGRAAMYTSLASPSRALVSSLAATLSPHTLFVPAASIALWRPADPDSAVPLALLPGHADVEASKAAAAAKRGALELVPMDPPPAELQGGVVAVMQAAGDARAEAVATSSVMGFIYVAELDLDRKRLRVLSPASGKVPPNALVWSGVEVEGLASIIG